MKYLKFSIRDLLFCVVIAALVICLWVERKKIADERETLRLKEQGLNFALIELEKDKLKFNEDANKFFEQSQRQAKRMDELIQQREGTIPKLPNPFTNSPADAAK